MYFFFFSVLSNSAMQPYGTGKDESSCMFMHSFSLVPWNAGIRYMLLNTDWFPLQCDIASLECITVVRTPPYS